MRSLHSGKETGSKFSKGKLRGMNFADFTPLTIAQGPSHAGHNTKHLLGLGEPSVGSCQACSNKDRMPSEI